MFHDPMFVARLAALESALLAALFKFGGDDLPEEVEPDEIRASLGPNGLHVSLLRDGVEVGGYGL